MSKKDYILIAKAFSATRPRLKEVVPYAQWEWTRNSLLHRLSLDNSKFNATKFREATEA